MGRNEKILLELHCTGTLEGEEEEEIIDQPSPKISPGRT
jgi:hypothetical protein